MKRIVYEDGRGLFDDTPQHSPQSQYPIARAQYESAPFHSANLLGSIICKTVVNLTPALSSSQEKEDPKMKQCL